MPTSTAPACPGRRASGCRAELLRGRRGDCCCDRDRPDRELGAGIRELLGALVVTIAILAGICVTEVLAREPGPARTRPACRTCPERDAPRLPQRDPASPSCYAPQTG